jgi:arginyl-tRNA synthetase
LCCSTAIPASTCTTPTPASVPSSAGRASSPQKSTQRYRSILQNGALALPANLGDALAEVGRELESHRLAGHLYDIARAFTYFYEARPVLSAEPAARTNRLALCDLTARTLRQVRGRTRPAVKRAELRR